MQQVCDASFEEGSIQCAVTLRAITQSSTVQSQSLVTTAGISRLSPWAPNEVFKL